VFVIPVEAGTHFLLCAAAMWIPAFMGMTSWKSMEVPDGGIRCATPALQVFALWFRDDKFLQGGCQPAFRLPDGGIRCATPALQVFAALLPPYNA
jgi:hypothetical protein